MLAAPMNKMEASAMIRKIAQFEIAPSRRVTEYLIMGYSHTEQQI